MKEYLISILFLVGCAHQSNISRIPGNESDTCQSIVAQFFSDRTLFPAEKKALAKYTNRDPIGVKGFEFPSSIKDRAYFSSLIMTIYDHPRFSDGVTQTLFAKGGPFRQGPDKQEMKKVIAELLKLPENEARLALRDVLKKLNSGDAGIDQALKLATENQKVFLSNADGNIEEVIFLNYISDTGEVNLLKEYPKNSNYILTAATFYEQLTEESLALFKFPNPPLPESEWLKVVKTQPLGKKGNLNFAEIKSSKPKNPFATISRTNPYDFSTRVLANGMNYATGNSMLEDFQKIAPELAKVFQIKTIEIDGKKIYQYPDVKLINSILDSLPESRKNSLRFVSDNRYLTVPTKLFANRLLKNGRLSMMSQGSGHFHDIFLHLIGYLALPEEILIRHKEAGEFIFKILDNPELMKNEVCRNWTKKALDDWMEQFDNSTGRFIETLSYAHSKQSSNEIDEKLERFAKMTTIYSAEELKKMLIIELEKWTTYQEQINVLESIEVPSEMTYDMNTLVKKMRMQLFLD